MAHSVRGQDRSGRFCVSRSVGVRGIMSAVSSRLDLAGRRRPLTFLLGGAAAVVLAGILLFAHPAGYATAPLLPSFVEQSEANTVELSNEGRNALNRLAWVYEGRPDLQGVFGIGADLNLAGLLDWVISQPDSSAQSLRNLVTVYREIRSGWAVESPFLGSVGAPGLPPAQAP